MRPTFRSILIYPGERAFYVVELFRNSTVAISATGDYAKIADTNCGMWVIGLNA
jgi:hypothetical protein